MWGFLSKPTSSCDNCGQKGFEHEKKDYECKKCGYKKPNFKVLDPIELIVCEGCSCTLPAPCTLHPKEQQHPFKG